MSAPDVQDEVAQRANQRVGQVLKGKYRLDRVIGIGGMAVVYAATHRNQKRVAVKMLHLELSYASTIRARFLREGYVANTVDHPGALAVLDEDTADDGAAFLVMELLEGKPLDVIAEGLGKPLDEVLVLAVAEQLTDVLAAAHAKAIVHRDIKPANLFITRDGTLKVLDFGIARLRDAAAADATSTGVVLGTPAFMAPEQAYGRNAEIDGQSDVWAVGATLFHLLTGRNVHGGGTASEMLIRAATSPAAPLASLRGDTHPRVAAVVDRALAFDKAARWPNAAAMRDEVRATLRDVFAGAPPGKTALAALIEEVGVPSTGASAGAFVPTGGTPATPAPRASTPWHEERGPQARPVEFAPTLAAASPESATAAPLVRSAPPTRQAPNTTRAIVMGVGAALALAALVITPLFATGRFHLGAQTHATASEPPTPTTPTPPMAATPPTPVPPPPVPSAAPSAPEPATAAPSTTASVAPSPSAAPAPSPPKAQPAVPANTVPASHPKTPAHPSKPSDDDLFHP